MWSESELNSDFVTYTSHAIYSVARLSVLKFMAGKVMQLAIGIVIMVASFARSMGPPLCTYVHTYNVCIGVPMPA